MKRDFLPPIEDIESRIRPLMQALWDVGIPSDGAPYFVTTCGSCEGTKIEKGFSIYRFCKPEKGLVYTPARFYVAYSPNQIYAGKRERMNELHEAICDVTATDGDLTGRVIAYWETPRKGQIELVRELEMAEGGCDNSAPFTFKTSHQENWPTVAYYLGNVDGERKVLIEGTSVTTEKILDGLCEGIKRTVNRFSFD